MKYAIVIPDGCADEPQASLGGRTPLRGRQHAGHGCRWPRPAWSAGPTMCRPRCRPGSDVANLSLLGYDPLDISPAGRRWKPPPRAIELGPDDWAIRCNLVTIEDQPMRDFTAGHISTEEAAAAAGHRAGEAVGGRPLQFFPGVSYRNLLIYRGGERPAPFTADTRATPPHDLTDKSVLDDYPRGPGSDLLNQLMNDSVACFADHPVNVARRKAGKPPATNIWLWGQGRTPASRRLPMCTASTGR